MEWYYEHNGQQAGPVSRAEMIRLILQRRIHPHTLVWTAEFGEQWRPAAKAGLIAPLSVKFMTSGDKTESSAPPSISGEKADPSQIPALWSWFILLPGLLRCLLYGLGLVRGQDPFRVSVLETFFLFMILMIAMVLDRKTLFQHGYRPPTLLWFLLLGLCPPFYLWSRYLILKKGILQAVLAVMMWAGMIGLFLYHYPDFFTLQFEQIQSGTQMPSWLKNHDGSRQGPNTPSDKGTPAPKSLDKDADPLNQGEIQL